MFFGYTPTKTTSILNMSSLKSRQNELIVIYQPSSIDGNISISIGQCISHCEQKYVDCIDIKFDSQLLLTYLFIVVYIELNI